MDYVELAISNSSLTTSLMVPVLWDSSCKLGPHYGPLKYFQKNVKNEKTGELWGYKKTVETGHVIKWYGEYLKASFHMADDSWMRLSLGP